MAMVVKLLLAALSLLLPGGAWALQIRSSISYSEIYFPNVAVESWYVWEAQKGDISSRQYFPFQMIHLRNTDPYSCRYALRNYVHISFDSEGSDALIAEYPGAHWAMILRQNVAAFGPPGYGAHTMIAAGAGNGIAVGRWGSSHQDWPLDDGSDGSAKFSDRDHLWWGPVVEWFTKPENGQVLDANSQLISFAKGAPVNQIPGRTRHYVTSFHVSDYRALGWSGPNLVSQAADAWDGASWDPLAGRYGEGPIQYSFDPYPYQYGDDVSFAVIFYDAQKFNGGMPATPLRFSNIRVDWAC